LSFGSQGARSQFKADYAFGWNRLAATPAVDSRSHVVSGTFSTAVSPKANLSIVGSASSTTDLQTILAVRGIIPTEDPTVIWLYFAPTAVNQTALSLRTEGTFDYRMSERSSVSIGGGYSLRDYQSSAFRSLSDQHGMDASVSYSRQITERSSWNVQYQLGYYTFENFDATVSNGVRLGFTNRLAKDTNFGSSFGISHVRNAGNSDYSASYEGTAELSHSIKQNVFQLVLSQNYGRPSGLNSVSRNRQLNLGVSRPLNQRLSVFGSGNLFDSKGVLDNTTGSRGGGAAGNLSVMITQKLSLQVGASMQRYAQPAPFAFTQKRVFASIRYTHANLLHSR
jgi:hypothetical protein